MSTTPERHDRPSRGRKPARPAAERRQSPTVGVVPDDRLRPLSEADADRYARHLALPQVGEAGQRRIRAAKVLVVGLGGLGSPVALYLAAAGVGTIGLADFDVVDESNLQRQVVHSTSDTGRAKVDSAADRLTALNPGVQVVRHPAGLTADPGPTGDDAMAVVAGYDVVVDCTDSFAARYLLNDVCLTLGTPWVHGSVWQLHGQISVFSSSGPCYRCLHPEPPDQPDGATGVLGVLPGIVGAVQAAEVLKLVVGGPTLVGRVLLVDAWSMRFDEVTLTKDPTCPACGQSTDASRRRQARPGRDG